MNFHKVKYSDEVILEAVRLSAKFIHKKLPDKSIDIIDEIGAQFNLNNNKKDIMIKM